MAYHEYVNARGQVIRRHYNGIRTETIDLPVNTPKDNHIFYQTAAEREYAKLSEQVGELTFEAWKYRTITEGMSWRDRMLAAWEAQQHPEALECACVTPEQSSICPICQSLSHVLSLSQAE